MVTIHDEAASFATVVSRRRQSRAATDGEIFRLGVHGVNCTAATGPATPSALLGASSWALKAEQVERTVAIIGIVGGLMTDLGYKVCPIGAKAVRADQTLIVWVCGDETQANEYERLSVLNAPGLSVGSCVHELNSWRFIESDPLDDRAWFTCRFVDEVAALVEGLADG